VELIFRELPLMPGAYHVQGEILRDSATCYFRPRVMASFVVASPLAAYGYRGRIGIGNARNIPPVVLPYEWRLPEEQK